MTIKFTIAQLERTTSDDAVYTVHWTASKTTGEYSGSSYGSMGFTPDPSSSGFIAYESLTEANVIGWVTDSMGEEQIAAMESAYDAQIAEQQKPSKASGTPWSA